MKEMKNGTEVPTDDKNDEKTGENNEKTEEVWQKKLTQILRNTGEEILSYNYIINKYICKMWA